MNVTCNHTQEHKQERNEEKYGVCRKACDIGSKHYGQRALMRNIIDMTFYKRMCIEYVRDKHADGATQGENMPSKASFTRVQASAGRLIDTTNQARTKTDAYDQLAQTMKA